MGAVFLVPKILADDSISIKHKDLEPQNILASRDLYFLKYCGRLTDGMIFYHIYYIQWEGGRGIIIDDNSPLVRPFMRLVPSGTDERDKGSTLLIKKNEIKREFSADIVNSKKTLDIVMESGIIDDILGGAIKKEKTGKKILKKIIEEC